MNDQRKTCPSCGKRNDAELVRCYTCGHALARAPHDHLPTFGGACPNPPPIQHGKPGIGKSWGMPIEAKLDAAEAVAEADTIIRAGFDRASRVYRPIDGDGSFRTGG